MPEWRYLRSGKVRHNVYPGPIENQAGIGVSACRAHELPIEEWYGTGSQTEYERAATMPTCKRCADQTRENLPDA